MRARHLLLVTLAWSVISCQSAPDTPPSNASPPVKSDTFKVVTYNTLHGLEVSKLWVRNVESDEERLARFTVRIQQLADTQPDVILLQEVNPLPDMAKRYVEALKARGLDYAQVHQVDACGLRIAPGIGIVSGLNNGLAIFAKAPLQLRMVGSIKLSGPFGGCGDYVGFQLGEFRYALLAEILAPGTELPYLVATMHLHSGIERDARLLQDLMEAHENGRLHHYEHLKAALTTDQQRRTMELHALLDAIHQQQLHRKYAGIIFGGDLNFEAGSPEYRELEDAGFSDSARLAIGMPMWNTYDPSKNLLAAHEEALLPPEFVDAIAEETAMDREEVLKVYRRAIAMARRIDFLFSASFMPTACLTQQLIGVPTPMRSGFGSDHYGLLNTYSFQRSGC
ncbi:MAG TPA: endonuclease/exonuclease/phosphatase family protein [Nitrospira sp.]|nr:endonuclease/exonuclease/phosphatase family protein [Nitrospira sp.]